MRSTSRLFMAAILLTVAAGFASAQEAEPPPPAPDAAVPVAEPVAELPPVPVTAAVQDPNAPPPPVPDAAVPVAELPPVPLAAPVQDPNAPPVDPALTIDPSVLAVVPAEVPIAQVPEPEKAVVTTTTTKVTKKIAKPVAKPLTEAEKLPAEPAPAMVGPLALERLPSADAAASTVPAPRIAPAPAAVDSTVVETLPETAPETGVGIGGWLLAGIVVAVMVGLITLVRRRWLRRTKAIIEFPQFSPEMKPLPLPVRTW